MAKDYLIVKWSQINGSPDLVLQQSMKHVLDLPGKWPAAASLMIGQELPFEIRDHLNWFLANEDHPTAIKRR